MQCEKCIMLGLHTHVPSVSKIGPCPQLSTRQLKNIRAWAQDFWITSSRSQWNPLAAITVEHEPVEQHYLQRHFIISLHQNSINDPRYHFSTQENNLQWNPNEVGVVNHIVLLYTMSEITIQPNCGRSNMAYIIRTFNNHHSTYIWRRYSGVQTWSWIRSGEMMSLCWIMSSSNGAAWFPPCSHPHTLPHPQLKNIYLDRDGRYMIAALANKSLFSRLWMINASRSISGLDSPWLKILLKILG